MKNRNYVSSYQTETDITLNSSIVLLIVEHQKIRLILLFYCIGGIVNKLNLL